MHTPSTSTQLPSWQADQYPFLRLDGSGARKLAASGVAPLVALARGYQTVAAGEVTAFAEAEHLGGRNTRPHRLAVAVAGENDFTTIPWFDLQSLTYAEEFGTVAGAPTLELRPATPFHDERTATTSRYVHLRGPQSLLDIHPGTPADWIAGSATVLLTDGVIKADAALTAQLAAGGLAHDQLQVTSDMTRADARAKLRPLMLGIETDHRVLVVARLGRGHWNHDALWGDLTLSNRRVLLAFDPNFYQDHARWKQAQGLWEHAQRKQATPALLNLAPTLEGELQALTEDAPSEQSPSLDDWLMTNGTWPQLLERVESELPEQPPIDLFNGEHGKFRVSEDGLAVLELVDAKMGPDGRIQPATWEVLAPIGGRVTSVEVHRPPSDEEIRTGRFGVGLDKSIPYPSTCTLALTWQAHDDTAHTVKVTGPATLLMHPPSDWAKLQTDLPNSLLLHPAFPPKRGFDWLQGIKSNAAPPATEVVSWRAMGWVPTEGFSIPSFISGNTVISPEHQTGGRVLPGITEAVLPRAGGFSLPNMSTKVLGKKWRAKVFDALDDTYDALIRRQPFADEAIAPVVIAAGLRPTVPLKCSAVLYLQGPPGQGKSWTISLILAFHQNGKTWTNKHLPGSVKDTGTSVEQALAQTNVWVMDDLAPSPSRYQSDQEQAKLGDVIRNVHNGTAKRRSGVDLKAREVFTPRALLITSAENEHVINSVRDRTVILNISRSSINSAAVEDTNDFRDGSKAPARLTVAAVQLFQHEAASTSWEGGLTELDALRKRLTVLARRIIGGTNVEGKSPTRHVEMAVDLMLGLVPLWKLAKAVNHRPFLEVLDMDDDNSLWARVAGTLSQTFQAQAINSLGRATLAAVRDVLAAGNAHLLNASDLNQPPLGEGQDASNTALGWQKSADGTWRSRGVNIGYVRTINDHEMLLLHPGNALKAAQEHSPALLPHGTSEATAWGSLWNEKLVHPHYAAKGKPANRHAVDVKIDGHLKRFVPVHPDQILGESENGDNETTDGEAATP
jgi:hypothetical protein